MIWKLFPLKPFYNYVHQGKTSIKPIDLLAWSEENKEELEDIYS